MVFFSDTYPLSQAHSSKVMDIYPTGLCKIKWTESQNYLVLMSSNRDKVWLDKATLEAVKSEAWSLMSSTILCNGVRHELCIWKQSIVCNRLYMVVGYPYIRESLLVEQGSLLWRLVHAKVALHLLLHCTTMGENEHSGRSSISEQLMQWKPFWNSNYVLCATSTNDLKGTRSLIFFRDFQKAQCVLQF